MGETSALAAAAACIRRKAARPPRREAELRVWMRGKRRRLMLGSITVKTQYAVPRSLSRKRNSIRAREPKRATCNPGLVRDLLKSMLQVA